MVKPQKLKLPKKQAHKKKILNPLCESIINGIAEKKGHETVTLDMRKLGNTIADYFIICHGESKIQVDAIARSVEETVYKTLGEVPLHKEGFQNLEWVILDYFNAVVHIFVKENREFYGIERLWADANTYYEE